MQRIPTCARVAAKFSRAWANSTHGRRPTFFFGEKRRRLCGRRRPSARLRPADQGLLPKRIYARTGFRFGVRAVPLSPRAQYRRRLGHVRRFDVCSRRGFRYRLHCGRAGLSSSTNGLSVIGATALETCALSLIAAGGIGNAIDRFVNGFVVDFIDLTFMDFPVFNIADIGVTCGFVLLVIGYLLATRPPSRKETTPSCDEGKEAHHD